MHSHQDVVVIGGGIIGLACAYYLVKENKSVTLIDQGRIGSGASHGNCGLLHFSGVIPLCSPGTVKHEITRFLKGTSPLYIKPTTDIDLYKWLIRFAASCNSSHMTGASTAKSEIMRYSFDLFNTLFETESLACDLEKKGVLYLFKDEAYFEKYARTSAFLDQYDFGAVRLDRYAVRELEPAVNERVVGGWFNDHDWHVRPDMLVSAWKKCLAGKGVQIIENCKHLDFEITSNRVVHANTGTGQLSADTFILTTGAWSADIKQQLDLNIPVQPGKGYSLTMEKPAVCPQIPCLLYERNMVATPWQSGYRLGGTMEFSGFNDILNKKRLNRLISGATEYLRDSTEHMIVEEWSGLRPMTYDDLPVIGRSPLQGNLFLATGHGMLGLTMATGTGKAVSDLVCHGRTDIDLSPYSVGRF
ncbi:MAG: FAD-dependent oxidoreductase [Desulfobacterales bacterium]|nr:FAD-dependent oxidoreductase [Desulfobacterales bacterium]